MTCWSLAWLMHKWYDLTSFMHVYYNLHECHGLSCSFWWRVLVVVVSHRYIYICKFQNFAYKNMYKLVIMEMYLLLVHIVW